jgi:hemerythrin superfamily protein
MTGAAGGVGFDALPPPGDALAQLVAEHELIDRLFDRFGDASSDDARALLATRICQMLALHASCEEELLYPAASVVLSDDRLVQEAEVEHAAAKQLVRQVELLSPGEPQFGPTLSVLREYVAHHVREEERGLFPRLRRSRLDLQALGTALATRRAELERSLGLSGSLDAPSTANGGPSRLAPEPQPRRIAP